MNCIVKITLSLYLLSAAIYSSENSDKKVINIFSDKALTYENRLFSSTYKNEMSAHIFRVIAMKKTNLVVSADVETSTDLLNLAEATGPHICALKLHHDIIKDFCQHTIDKLKTIAREKNFLIIVDRKFTDIDSTVKEQYVNGPFKIASWADLVTVQALPGVGMIKAMQEAIIKEKLSDGPRGVLLITDMSCEGALTDETYRKKALEVADQCHDFVAGFITRIHDPKPDRSFIRFTPGISLDTKKIGAQQYLTPEEAFCEHGTDVAIVGRGIYQNIDSKELLTNEKINEKIVEKVIRYKNACWNAYLKRTGQQQIIAQ